MANALEGVLEELNARCNIEKELEECFDPFNQAFHNYVSRIKKAVEVYQQTGVMSYGAFENWEDCENVEENGIVATERTRRNSSKENIKPVETKPEKGARGRPRRNNVTGYSQDVSVKKEKSASPVPSDIEEVKVKTEVEEMPAPTRPAPRKKRGKKTEVQVKQEKIKTEKRDSDVIIEEPPVPVVEVRDSDEEKPLKPEENVRSTRTKTKAKKLKRARAPSSDDESREKNDKRSKSGSEFPVNELSETNYEDAVSTVGDTLENNNVTYIAKSPIDKEVPLMNATVVIEKPKCVKTVEDIMTDDESEDEKSKPPTKTLSKTVTKSKPVFSPFEPSPVKKKVQAFEKLREQANAIPVRITRTKTRANAKKQEDEAQNEAENEVAKSVVKEKAKLFTPMASKFLPAASSTTQKSKGSCNQASNESILSAKSASALKASQAEYRERERRRREKEQEAMRKREAILQAQIEEKKRKREEKQLKAQQQREVLEKEKLKALEVQRLKDERHKQVLAEQEERKQKQREEIEKKRHMAKMRALEEKKKEEERRLEEQKKNDELTARLAKQDEDIARLVEKQKTRRELQKQAPIYMKTKPQLLPTEDCYDSDDEEYASSIKLPQWTSGVHLKNSLRFMLSAGETIKNTFFSRQAITPDLQEIFEVIDVQKLKRSSSAIWHKPPRYTMMPTALANHAEDDEFSDD